MEVRGGMKLHLTIFAIDSERHPFFICTVTAAFSSENSYHLQIIDSFVTG